MNLSCLRHFRLYICVCVCEGTAGCSRTCAGLFPDEVRGLIPGVGVLWAVPGLVAGLFPTKVRGLLPGGWVLRAVPELRTGLFPVEVRGPLPYGSRAVPSDLISHGTNTFTSPLRAAPAKVC